MCTQFCFKIEINFLFLYLVYIYTNIIIHEGSELYFCNGSEIEIRQRQDAVRVKIIVLATWPTQWLYLSKHCG